MMGRDSFATTGQRRLARAVLVVLVMLAVLSVFPERFASAQAAPGQPPQVGCIDVTQPDTLVSLYYEVPTRTYNWATGQSSSIHPYALSFCGENGLLYSKHPDGTIWRFTTRDPNPRQVERIPTHTGRDGSLYVYALESQMLLASSDGGLTWQERGQEFAGKIESLSVAWADARSIVIVVVERAENTNDLTYALYASWDAGATWERRHDGALNPDMGVHTNVSVRPLPGYAVPADAFLLEFRSSLSHYSGTGLHVTLDGGRSFNVVGTASERGVVDVAYSQGTLLRVAGEGFSYGYARSRDQGRTWETIPGPPAAHPQHPFVTSIDLLTPQNGLAGLLLHDPTGVWYTSDQGSSWTQLSAADSGVSFAQVTPYQPATLLVRENQGDGFTAVRLPDEGHLRTGQVALGKAGDGLFFPETGHNLSGVFRRYWEANGGLAQFGYPKTEPFRELNPADGKVYLVQYFERNRFEYHPELAGTSYEVLLGLLGNQFTIHRQSEPPFQRVSGATQPDAVFFPETGHTLRGAFKPYWEANGGLAMYGYPISEEFLERNEDDGKTYIVQYFERARFEYHEENKGTRYEVLLGLLGNKLLREKGWL